jgi:uncharacterized protein (DUF2147 family)
MKKNASKLLLIMLISTSSFAQGNEGDKVLGKWKTAANDLIIEVYRHDNLYEGKVIWFAAKGVTPMSEYIDSENPAAELRNRSWIGMVTITGLQYENGHEWIGGKVYDPSSGHTYSASIKMTGNDVLNVRGYWFLEILGKTLKFIRVR